MSAATLGKTSRKFSIFLKKELYFSLKMRIFYSQFAANLSKKFSFSDKNPKFLEKTTYISQCTKLHTFPVKYIYT